MKTIIAGSRQFDDYEILCEVIRESGINVTAVVVGQAPGLDMTAERWADLTKTPKEVYSPDWKKDSKAANQSRNNKMSKSAQAAILICINKSKDSYEMIEKAKAKKLKLYVQYVEKNAAGQWVKLHVFKNY